MRITIRRPNGDKIWECTVGPRMNLPAMAAEENGDLHVAGLEQYPIIRPPWKIEIEPVTWAVSAYARGAMTIEEARATLEQSVRTHVSAETSCAETLCVVHIVQEADAYALAMVEEMLGGCNSAACGSIQRDGSIWRCRPCALRTRIMALGNDHDHN